MVHGTARSIASLTAALCLGWALMPPPSQAGGPYGRSCAHRERVLVRSEAVLRFVEHFSRGPYGAWFQRLQPWARGTVAFRARQYADHCVGLNQVQVLGTHNSYHIEPPQSLIDFYLLFDPSAIELQYSHRPLAEQFAELGVRQIELDVFADPEGGLYSEPLGLQILTDDPDARIPELDAPGIKVLHIQEIDWITTCLTLEECLAPLKAWSDSNPEHLPVFVLIEAKDDPAPDPLDLGFAVPVPWGAEEFDELDATIRSVFPPHQLITPDDVRGRFPTLESAVLERGWPRLRQARGRILFGLDNGGTTKEIYRAGRPSLEGRVLFTDGTPGEPDAAFVKVNGPLGNEDLIHDLVAEGYIVRTRADAGTFESRLNDPTRRDVALASGAQYVSSDYPEPDLRFSDYVVTIPDGEPGRCNPVNAPPGCRNAALER